MFDELLKEIKRMKKTRTYTMQVLPDSDGYFDKECPNQECLSKFKVYADDWDKNFNPQKVYCPFCGTSAPGESWWTTEQIEQAEKQAYSKLKSDFSKAMSIGVKNCNKKLPKKGFVTFNLKYKSNIDNFIDLPAYALEELEQKIVCENCGARYAVIGSAFFCPCCGYNSVINIFNNTIEKVRGKIKNIKTIYKAVAVYSKDDAGRTCSSLIETSIPDLVIAFQRLCECIYLKLPNAKPLKKNVFQRLDDGDKLWIDVIGKGYLSWITVDEYTLLKKCFQQRHCLQHQDGIVDNDYIIKSGDTSYKMGQHLIIKERNVLEYADIIEKLGNEILKIK